MNGQFVKEYIVTVSEKYKTGQAKEHAYRPALEKLFQDITGLEVINDPKQSEYGAPDFVFIKDKLALAYAEAKDVKVSLDEIEKSEQVVRYFGYSNLILTNYLEFRFFRNGEKYGEPIKIAEIIDNKIIPAESSTHLQDEIAEFIAQAKEPIKSGALLAKVMAGKARRIRDNISVFLAKDGPENQSLMDIYNVIRKMLLPDLDYERFADMYAQTVVYGLFVARYHDESPGTFSRQEARDLMPASNPFLREFFNHIAGPSYDPRIEFIVKELCEEFGHADVSAIVHNYYKTEKDNNRDPIIHFYEDFLKEYDPKSRMKLGVFYTPLPVARFIVRSVDEILKKDFKLAGLSDSSEIEIKKQIQNNKVKATERVHKVQILDPATGTGTFLNEVISLVHESFVGQEGRWPSYVREDFLPRLHGFELMMASYVIAHLKLSSSFKETGVDLDGTWLGVYLTNSLEKAKKEDDTLFAGLGFDKAITAESKAAGKIKTELPIMVVLGNPPYSGVSSNETEYANSLVEKYKVEPGGKQKLQERKHWLNDDYVKFIALAENMVEKNGEGIVGYITNHGYLDNQTFRGMRWHLMDTFDSIYVFDLHGNAKKHEVSPDGSKDENVFDIQQGVAIIIAVKTGVKKAGNLAKVYRADLWGKREHKFERLNELSIENTKWLSLKPRTPYLFFAPEGSMKLETEYQIGFSINELFVENSTGIVTMGDGFIIGEDKESLENRVVNFLRDDDSENILKENFNLGKNYAKWIIGNKKDIVVDHDKITTFSYRPFDDRYTYFDNKLVWRPRTKIMRNFVKKNNIGLIATRLNRQLSSGYFFLTSKIVDFHILDSAGDSTSAFPLYLYFEDGTKSSNLKKEMVSEIEKIVGDVVPENIFDYIYAVLHSPSYREKYKEFLKIDFPRVPYPKNEKQFFALAKLGEELRHLHLLESPKVEKFITTYPEAGENLVEKVVYKDGKVYINASQYFGGVPEVAWDFYIGGYQPAQKWLKDRKGRKLTNADIEHYQKIIVALVETDRIMKEIDKNISI